MNDFAMVAGGWIGREAEFRPGLIAELSLFSGADDPPFVRES